MEAAPPSAAPPESGAEAVKPGRVRYGDAPWQTLRLYGAPPNGDEARPLMVYVHGGAWMAGDDSRVAAKPRAFQEAGWHFASVGYRLEQGSADPGAQAGDVGAALDWLTDNAAAYGIDPQRIFVMGHSAGAHLAALSILAADYGADEGQVAGAVLLDGAGYDVRLQIEELAQGRNLRLYRTVFGDDPAAWRRHSPTLRAGEIAPPPFLIIPLEQRRTSMLQSTGLAAALRDAGGEATVLPAEGTTHSALNRDFGEPDDPVTAAVFAWLAARSAAPG